MYLTDDDIVMISTNWEGLKYDKGPKTEPNKKMLQLNVEKSKIMIGGGARERNKARWKRMERKWRGGRKTVLEKWTRQWVTVSTRITQI